MSIESSRVYLIPALVDAIAQGMALEVRTGQQLRGKEWHTLDDAMFFSQSYHY